MKRLLQIVFFAGIFIILGNTTVAQGSAGWQILVNNDHSPFTIRIYNNEMTFFLSPKTDTLYFSLNNNKPIKDVFTVEVTLRNSKKSIFVSTEKNLLQIYQYKFVNEYTHLQDFKNNQISLPDEFLHRTESFTIPFQSDHV